jgi:uracil-DNA glycosylase family 4
VNRTLDEVALDASTCTRCRLSAGRTQVVFGDGTGRSGIMFIGEGPGFHEDKQGLPFVGAAGQLLNRLLGEIGLSREDVYICNVIKCLRYNAPIQLGDGSWQRIGRLVRSQYDGLVMSVDADGRIVRRRVIGWHESPLAGRRVFRMTFRSAKRTGTGQASIQLTGEHPVLTDRGWLPVEKVPLGARIATGQGLSPLAFDVVCGTLLGDGHLNASSAHLSFGHSGRQAEYAEFKAQLLEELSPRLATVSMTAVSGGARTYPTVQVRTLANRALGVLRPEFYGHGKRIPPWIADRLNARMLAIWFMDDGHTRIRPPRQPLAEIATLGFREEDLSSLLRGLARLGLPAKAMRGRVYFNVAATRRLSELIAPYVPTSMRYKLHPESASDVPFNPSLLEVGQPEVLYDEVEIEDVTDSPRSDTTFFCIDVEETQSFVTAGGVVHNCRPPGNRDPLPDEIESCRPWLEEQIRLVNPRVIVTLGNFATRVILDRPVSISRVRGQKQIVGGRVVIPTFHPAAILRGGGDASVQMGNIRSDFAAIVEALKEAPAPVEEQLGLF